ncbi:adenosine 3'-phospho 5'-phosphosulfate transporter 2 [Platysternon megacephalum]|uniref:Adenosine 3'-phospho 5'-phosphosulfate transporter 2 n=1 Tax=Platysternon megacephalum TaxID=55544 RepID=A0A4D9EQY7_9SAUR|nr:adenosine 3'-phospho 5'-phosphosulfate transporter 2 [Platysternon megacephalum]
MKAFQCCVKTELDTQDGRLFKAQRAAQMAQNREWTMESLRKSRFFQNDNTKGSENRQQIYQQCKTNQSKKRDPPQQVEIRVVQELSQAWATWKNGTNGLELDLVKLEQPSSVDTLCQFQKLTKIRKYFKCSCIWGDNSVKSSIQFNTQDPQNKPSFMSAASAMVK